MFFLSFLLTITISPCQLSCLHLLNPPCHRHHLSASLGMTKSALAHTLNMNAQCPLPHTTIITEINGSICHHHCPPRLMRVASIGSCALTGMATLPLVLGVLTPISHSCATQVLVRPVRHMVSTLLWCHFAVMRTSSRLIRVSRTTSLISWITPQLHLGSGGAVRQTNVPIASMRRMTLCGKNSHLLGHPNSPLLRLRAQAHLPSAMHPLLSCSQGGRFWGTMMPHQSSMSHRGEIPQSSLPYSHLQVPMPSQRELLLMSSTLAPHKSTHIEGDTWMDVNPEQPVLSERISNVERDNCSQILLGWSGPVKY